MNLQKIEGSQQGFSASIAPTGEVGQSAFLQVTTQLLFIQWLDNFQAHARMALPPADA